MFSLPKRIYSSLHGKRDLRDTGQRRGLTILGRDKCLGLKLRLYSFNTAITY